MIKAIDTNIIYIYMWYTLCACLYNVCVQSMYLSKTCILHTVHMIEGGGCKYILKQNWSAEAGT